MMSWMALVVPLLLQDPTADLRKQIEALKKQNAELQERLSLLEQGSIDDAHTIQRLREVVKLLEAAKPASGEAPASPKGPAAPALKPEIGPLKPIRAKVVYVDVKSNFIALSVGKQDKVEVGYKFQILRETYENGGESRLVTLGMGEVEKFLGQDSMAKLVIKEGNIADMKVDDLAVAIRKLGDLPAKGEPLTEAKIDEADLSTKEGVYRITAILGDGYVINYGSMLGARQTQLLYAYRDGKFKAKLRLDKVERNHSIGYVIDGTMQLPPEQGDQVYVRELNKGLAGKVALSDAKQNRIAIDLRQKDGVKSGMHCEVRRLGQKIGVITITDVQSWGSWAKPEGDLNTDQIQKGDFVEVIEEK